MSEMGSRSTVVLAVLATTVLAAAAVASQGTAATTGVAPAVSSSSSCSAFSDCLACTNTTRQYETEGCRWCRNSCKDAISAAFLCESETTIRYDDMCPVAPQVPSPYLANWMGENMDVIGSLTLLDLSLPGTHDTLTYDLSARVSDGGIDDYPELARILHDFSPLVPDGIEDFIRQQAETHDLTITQQLENGIRFFDIRAMYEYSDKLEAPDWYSLHCVESNHPSMTYFREINDFLNVHTSEVVVMWLSKHGSECAVGNDAYPNVSIATKQAFWDSIATLYADKIVDFAVTPINSTSLRDMVAANQRVVFYVSDYAEFTNSSTKALDGCSIDNRLPPCANNNATEAFKQHRDVFKNAQATIDEGKKNSKFLLMSMAGGGPGIAAMFSLRFFKTEVPGEEAKCASKYSYPGMTWCPPTLLDQSQLENYYAQQTIEETITVPGYRLPNAIYINGVDWDGTIRTGTQVEWGAVRNFHDLEHYKTGYAYVDTFILNNLMIACANENEKSVACKAKQEYVQSRRAKHPLQTWEDAAFGRLVNFP
jgi:hypothetical protein